MKIYRYIGTILILVLVSAGGLYYRTAKSIEKDSKSRDLELLRALPYATASCEEGKTRPDGVIKYDRNKAFFGYNLYVDYDKDAYLMNMAGDMVHRWHLPFKWAWEYAELTKDGGLIALGLGKCVVKLDKNSNILWAYAMPAHHDIAVLSDGTYIIPLRERDKKLLYNHREINFDSLSHISDSGKVLDEWSTYVNFDALRKHHPPSMLDKKKDANGEKGIKKIGFYADNILDPLRKLYVSIQNSRNRLTYRNDKRLRRLGRKESSSIGRKSRSKPPLLITTIGRWVRSVIGIKREYDYYHLNAIKILPETILAKRDKRFKGGNYLVCLRNADLILILDKNSKEILWSWGPGILDRPHDPTMLEDGDILIFDNGAHRGFSRILEINPVTRRIVWEYKANPPKSFYTQTRGSCQRLPNGNTLICESRKSHVFEITKRGEIVWEFINPNKKMGMRRSIYRMRRIPKGKTEAWLSQNTD